MVELADKLHNLLSDYELYKEKGKDAITSLKTSYENKKWYYLEMKCLFNAKLSKTVCLTDTMKFFIFIFLIN